MTNKLFGLLPCIAIILLAANAEDCKPVYLPFRVVLKPNFSYNEEWVAEARRQLKNMPKVLFKKLGSGSWEVSERCSKKTLPDVEIIESGKWYCFVNLTYHLPTFDYASSLGLLFPEVTIPKGNTSLDILKKRVQESIYQAIKRFKLPRGGIFKILDRPLSAEEKGRHSDGIPPKACSVTDGLKQLQGIVVNDTNANDVVAKLERLTSNPTVLTSTDIALSANTLQKLTDGSSRKKEVGERIVQTINNLMDADTTHLARAEATEGSATRLLKCLEEYSLTADIEGDQSQQIQRNDITLQMWDLNKMSDSPSGFCHKSDGTMINCKSIDDEDVDEIETAIIMSEEAKQQVQKYHEDQQQGKIRMAFVLQKKASLFLSPGQLKSPGRRSDVDGEVMALKLPPNYSKQVEGDILAIFRTNETKTGIAICVFWDFDAAGGRGDWSTIGCSKKSTKKGRVVCQCNHLTNFAILTGSTVNHKALSIITYIGLGVSTIGLLLTIITFLVFRKKLHFGHGQKVLVNLAVALLCVNVIFLVGIKRTENKHVCVAMAALLHYLLLVAFAWMLVEAVLQYLRLVKVIGTHVDRFMLKAALPSWSVPAVLVIVFLSMQYGMKYDLYQNSDGDSGMCWLEEYPMYFAFLLPIGVIIFINTALYIRIVKSITCDRSPNLRSTQSKADLTKLQVLGSLGVFVLLGLTWIFGFLTIEGVTPRFPFFDYVFCVLNSFQGFLIFLFHTFRNKQIRDSWYRLMCPSSYNKREAKKKKSDPCGKQKTFSVLTVETSYKTHSFA